MSILSDISIAKLCQLPTTKLDFSLYEAGMRRIEAEYNKFDLTKSAPERHADRLVAGLKRDLAIKELAESCQIPLTQEELDAQRPMIRPFRPESVKRVEDRRIISKGLTSFGYDVSLTTNVKIFSNINSAEIDPKRFDEEKCLVTPIIRTAEDGSLYVTLPANSYLLGVTEEYFDIPRDLLVICLGKSTYARSGVVINTTPGEPEFEGQIVIEVFNGTTSPVRVYLNEGIAQFLFLQGDQPCGVSYKDRAGKYMGQTGITMSKV